MQLLYEQRKKALSKLQKVDNEPEMSEFDSAYLCGIIKEKKPQKILEIGVAAGATTAIVMQCINDFNLTDCEFVSVDLAETYYRDIDGGRKTGFLGIEMEKFLPNIDHRLILGAVIAECIEDVGGKIDMVILDTVHYLPGEILDFPVILPYLAENAVVVIHDVGYHFITNRSGYSNLSLINATRGIKDIPFGGDVESNIITPNIGSIIVTKETTEYIEDVFRAMLLPWFYMPEDPVLEAYRRFYINHYDKKLVNIYDIAVNDNKLMISKSAKKPKIRDISKRIVLGGRMILKGY